MTDGFEGCELSHRPSLVELVSPARAGFAVLAALVRKSGRHLASWLRALAVRVMDLVD